MTTPKSTGKLKFKTFNVSLARFVVVALLALATAGYLAYAGWKEIQSPIVVRYHDPVVFAFCILRFSFCGAVILGIVATLLNTAGKSVTVSPGEISCNQGGRSFTLPWHSVIITPSGKKPFRSILVSDGKQFYRVEEFFFPDFDLLSKVLRSAVEKEREQHTV